MREMRERPFYGPMSARLGEHQQSHLTPSSCKCSYDQEHNRVAASHTAQPNVEVAHGRAAPATGELRLRTIAHRRIVVDVRPTRVEGPMNLGGRPSRARFAAIVGDASRGLSLLAYFVSQLS